MFPVRGSRGASLFIRADEFYRCIAPLIDLQQPESNLGELAWTRTGSHTLALWRASRICYHDPTFHPLCHSVPKLHPIGRSDRSSVRAKSLPSTPAGVRGGIVDYDILFKFFTTLSVVLYPYI